MASVVAINTDAGTLTRYEIGGQAIRKTHKFCAGTSAIFLADDVEWFRANPPDALSLEPPPRPTSPTSGVGRAAA